MILLLIAGLVLIGVVIGGAGMRRVGKLTRRMIGPWRPGVGVGALICLFGGAGLAARGAVVEGALLAAVGVLMAFGARRWSPAPSTDAAAGMSLDEARRILGVDPSADLNAIDSAYRRLMQRAHPDLGGTSGLAAQLNAARTVLTKRR